ncbi:MAG: hypothetical protein ABI705_09035 [Aestuariivirga sp.]
MEKIQTAESVRSAIIEIIRLRRIDADSDYDRKVVLRAIRSAEETFEAVPLKRTARMYCEAVVKKLTKLMDGYYDSDGEYSSGIADLGTIKNMVNDLLRRIEE